MATILRIYSEKMPNQYSAVEFLFWGLVIALVILALTSGFAAAEKNDMVPVQKASCALDPLGRYECTNETTGYVFSDTAFIVAFISWFLIDLFALPAFFLILVISAPLFIVQVGLILTNLQDVFAELFSPNLSILCTSWSVVIEILLIILYFKAPEK